MVLLEQRTPVWQCLGLPPRQSVRNWQSFRKMCNHHIPTAERGGANCRRLTTNKRQLTANHKGPRGSVVMGPYFRLDVLGSNPASPIE